MGVSCRVCVFSCMHGRASRDTWSAAVGYTCFPVCLDGLWGSWASAVVYVCFPACLGEPRGTLGRQLSGMWAFLNNWVGRAGGRQLSGMCVFLYAWVGLAGHLGVSCRVCVCFPGCLGGPRRTLSRQLSCMCVFLYAWVGLAGNLGISCRVWMFSYMRG